MTIQPIIWSRTKINEVMKDMLFRSTLVQLDSSKIPAALQVIQHYAEIWGIPDETERIKLISNTPIGILQNLCDIMIYFQDDIEVWLCGDEADSENPTDEYVCYSAFMMALDDAWTRCPH